MDIYDLILDGLLKQVHPPGGHERYLNSLQAPVRELRKAYRIVPVHVPYHKQSVQSAYLLTYLPHYYLLIHNIILENIPEIFDNKKYVNLSFIGGGPGSEAYGVIKYIFNNCSEVDKINVNILDINAETWPFSHEVVNKYLIQSANSRGVEINWQSVHFDITDSSSVEKSARLLAGADLIVIQNCLNEIERSDFGALVDNVKSIIREMKGNAYLVMTDLTSGARDVLNLLNAHLKIECPDGLIKSTLKLPTPISMLSVHHHPSERVRRHLLTGADGLIPRKYLKHDYLIFTKGIEAVNTKRTSTVGFKTLYRPLDFERLDANDFIHSKVFIGIDFGSSTTVVSMARLIGSEINVETIPLEQKNHLGTRSRSPLLPSIITLVGDQILVGKYAAEFRTRARLGIDTWYNFKASLSQLDKINYPESLLRNDEDFHIANGTDALVLFFKYLKLKLDKHLHEKGLTGQKEYSISIPAGFSSIEKHILKNCLIEAGIDCEDTPFIEEPNAALLNYLFENGIGIGDQNDKYLLVVDLGAGTIDVSLLLLTASQDGLQSQLISVKRIGNIGGDVLDRLVARHISNIRSLQVKDKLNILIAACERLKITLCKGIHIDKPTRFTLPPIHKSKESISVPVPVELFTDGLSQLSIQYAEFNEIINEYWMGSEERPGVRETVIMAIDEADIAKERIDQIILTGGGSRNPYIVNRLAGMFSPEKLFIPDNIQEHVARGTALHSFVVNSFGKNIITPILSHDMIIQCKTESMAIFRSGLTIPTNDVDMAISPSLSEETRYIQGYMDMEKEKSKYFEIPPHIAVLKTVFYIGPDQELKCDLVTNQKVINSKVVYRISHNKLVDKMSRL